MSRPAGNLRGEARRVRWTWLLWLLGAAVWLFHGAFLVASSRERGLTQVEEAFFDPQTTTPKLALGVFLYLLYHRRVALRAAFGSPPNGVAAAPLLAVGGVLLAWAQSIDAPDLARLAFVFWVAGSAFWLGGSRLARVVAFPLLAIVLAVPLPSGLTNQVLLPLQLATAKFAALLLSLFGQESQLMGDQILRPGLVFHVIEGCSGYRSIFSLWLATVLYADLACRNARERVLLLVAVPFVGFLLNGLRVLVLILREVPSETSEHAVQGLLMIVLGMSLVAALEIKLWPLVFARSRTRARGPWLVETESSGDSSYAPSLLPLNRRLIALSCLISVVAIAFALWPKPIPTTPLRNRLNPEEIGTGFAGWSIEALRREPHLLGSTQFRHLALRAFTRGPDRITTFVGAEDRSARGRSGWSPKTELPASGWLAIEPLEPTRVGGQTVERRRVRYPGRTVLVYHWRQGYAGWAEELLRDWLSLDHTPWQLPHSSVVVRLELDVGAGVTELGRADALLQALAERFHQDIAQRLDLERARADAKTNTS